MYELSWSTHPHSCRKGSVESENGSLQTTSPEVSRARGDDRISLISSLQARKKRWDREVGL
jgi:hypothetical protein